jgi:hypothetical protein
MKLTIELNTDLIKSQLLTALFFAVGVGTLFLLANANKLINN